MSDIQPSPVSNPFSALNSSYALRAGSPAFNAISLHSIQSQQSSVQPKGKKRKASQDDSEMSSPLFTARSLSSSPTSYKRHRCQAAGSSLPLSRLIEHLDTSTLRSLLKELCERNLSLQQEVISIIPPITVSSALSSIQRLENDFRQAFPYGGDPANDYSYNRVRGTLLNLMSALSDYTPHFLPPNEKHINNSLVFVEGITSIVQRIPDFHNKLHNIQKSQAYAELDNAWVLCITEALKHSGGISFMSAGWPAKIENHHKSTGHKLVGAIKILHDSGLDHTFEVQYRTFGFDTGMRA
ncbi:Tethering factor for nuclear proteasome sts1 [Neolecta irregularis DAH-3]|uniref:Tethering factor for nuclear proteasome STS1 n=1 Tax=Neolecta irregularis (strain DAH-3) TaxID=1198029 RepID=A0A1U7LIS3_NEOID|nr:Tethering factor for nuclear proteasome sts1 [Neolecta irregularis DAH-3]|eukprot:OLL22555.1 Tethering factor for nuclear proteasome sts1 [Neolecta irregularis DAH-3]